MLFTRINNYRLVGFPNVEAWMTMRITRRLVAAALALSSLVVGVWALARRSPLPSPDVSAGFVLHPAGIGRCATDVDVYIKALASDGNEARTAFDNLLSVANGSADCREVVIRELISGMNKSDLDFEADRPSFFLWSNGAVILGRLKAVEALDLLIDKLDQSDGLFSSSMSHQPAIAGVEAMGPIAIAKLSFALEHHERKAVRLAAAVCLFDIGGDAGMKALRSGLNSQSEPCVRHFIELLLEPTTSEIIQQRLRAFRCGN